jgi:hypothetical protein
MLLSRILLKLVNNNGEEMMGMTQEDYGAYVKETCVSSGIEEIARHSTQLSALVDILIEIAMICGHKKQRAPVVEAEHLTWFAKRYHLNSPDDMIVWVTRAYASERRDMLAWGALNNT